MPGKEAAPATSQAVDPRVQDPTGRTLDKINVDTDQYWVDANGVKHLYGHITDVAGKVNPPAEASVLDDVAKVQIPHEVGNIGYFIGYGLAGALVLVILSASIARAIGHHTPKS